MPVVLYSLCSSKGGDVVSDQAETELLTTEEAAKLAGVSARTLIRWRDEEKRLQSYPTRRPVIEARPGVGWRRSEVLKAAGKPVDEVSGQATE